jgi:pimeloyl-ACP methyl ester carboxylesterase
MRSMVVEAADARMFYHDLPGGEPALVMIHGLGSASSSWYPSAAHHPGLRSRRAILVDLLGFGYSDRPQAYDYSMASQAANVAGLLDHLELSGCAVIGHSMGGSIAILLAAARPDLVSHLIVAEGNLDPGPGFISGRITSVSETAFVTTKYHDFCSQMRAAGFYDYASTLRASDPLGLYRSAVSLIAPRSPTYRQHLIRRTGPSTFLFGELSLPDPDEQVLRAHGIDVRVVPATGHDMMGGNPNGFADTVAEALHSRP